MQVQTCGIEEGSKKKDKDKESETETEPSQPVRGQNPKSNGGNKKNKQAEKKHLFVGSTRCRHDYAGKKCPYRREVQV